MERRITNGGQACRLETRADGGKTAVGYGAVFYRAGDAGTEYPLGKGVAERVDARAFDAALQRGDDVRALFNHEPDHLLGRLSSGTLRLSVDDSGLRYEIDLPDTQAGRDVATSIERGDLSGSSFSFNVERADWSEENGRDIRTIKSVRLFDVGPVTYPAYAGTSAALRSEGDDAEAQAEREAWKEAQAQTRRARFQKSARARLLDIEA
jgi:HK97 family phage prohead protease